MKHALMSGMLVVAGVLAPLSAQSLERLHPWGMPDTDYADCVVLHNTGYDVCYSDVTLAPIWAAYYYPDGDHDTYDRRKFRGDPRLSPNFAPPAKEYKGIYSDDRSGYDQGHLAPHATMAAFGLDAVKESYYVTNMTPQHTELNQGFWRLLEDETREWVREDDTIWVVTGPVFHDDEPAFHVGTEERIPVPHAYFHVAVRFDRGEDEDVPEVLAFLVPHTPEGYEREDAASFIVSVDSIEEVTWLDLFPDLSEELESEPGTMW